MCTGSGAATGDRLWLMPRVRGEDTPHNCFPTRPRHACPWKVKTSVWAFLPKDANSTALWTDTKKSSHLKEPSTCVTVVEVRCWCNSIWCKKTSSQTVISLDPLLCIWNQIGSLPILRLPKTFKSFSNDPYRKIPSPEKCSIYLHCIGSLGNQSFQWRIY